MNSTVSLLCLGLLVFGSLAWAQDQPQVNSPEQVPVTEEGGMKSGQVHEDVVQAESEHGGEVMPSEGESQPVAAEVPASNAVEAPVEGGHKQQPEASQTSGEAPPMPEQQQGQVAEEEAAVAPEPTAVEPVEAPAVESAQNEEKHPEQEEVEQHHEEEAAHPDDQAHNEEEKATAKVAEPAKVPESAEKAPENEAGEKKAEEKKDEEPKSGEEPKKDEKETDAPKVSPSELQSNSTTNSTVTEQEQKNAGAGSFWGKLVCLITRFYCPSSSLSGDDDDSKASNNSTETNSGQKHRGLRAGGMMIINVGDSSSGGEEDENEELASMEKDHPLSGEVQDGETKVNAKVKVNATMMESVVDENGKGQSNITQINAEMHN